jgi:hypothetical protein
VLNIGWKRFTVLDSLRNADNFELWETFVQFAERLKALWREGHINSTARIRNLDDFQMTYGAVPKQGIGLVVEHLLEVPFYFTHYLFISLFIFWVQQA